MIVLALFVAIWLTFTNVGNLSLLIAGLRTKGIPSYNIVLMSLAWVTFFYLKGWI